MYSRAEAGSTVVDQSNLSRRCLPNFLFNFDTAPNWKEASEESRFRSLLDENANILGFSCVSTLVKHSFNISFHLEIREFKTPIELEFI